MKKVPPEEYYKTIPKKRMSAGALLFNEEGKLLIVKPTYKDGWSIPGGVIDEDESPQSAVVREVREEIGLDIDRVDLAGVSYVPMRGIRPEGVHFIFSSKTLVDDEIARIKLQPDEIGEFKFVSLTEAEEMFLPEFKKRVLNCVEAIKNKTVVYME